MIEADGRGYRCLVRGWWACLLTPNLLVVLLSAAPCWGSLQWLVLRYSMPGTLPLLPAAMLALLGYWALQHARRMQEAPAHPFLLLGSAACLALYAYSYGAVPGLVSLSFAVAALGLTFIATLPAGARKISSGILPVLFFALPLEPTLNFYAGHPLRVAVAEGVAFAFGSNVAVSGTGIHYKDVTLFVDGPCSGVRMLSIAGLLAGGLGLALGLSLVRTLLLLSAALLLAFLGNLSRALLLFVNELTLAEPFPHNPIGVAVFSGCLVLLAVIARWLEPSSSPESDKVARKLHPAVLACFLVAALGAAVSPLRTATPDKVFATSADIQWPRYWGGERLVEVEGKGSMSEGIGFAGAAKEFSLADTHTRVLLRQCLRVTRMLHSSEECYRAMGWNVSPLPPIRDDKQRIWSRFLAVHPTQGKRTVRQLFVALEGDMPADLAELPADAKTWPEVSSWYWAAARPSSEVERTLAITVAAPVQEPEEQPDEFE